MKNYSILGNYYSNNGYNTHRAYITRNNNVQNPIQYNMLQIEAKCPHGFPGGAGCPICMGKTGGGGGPEKAKKKVGMSWSEASYIYALIQRGKMLAIQDKKLSKTTKAKFRFLERIQASMLYQKILAIKNSVDALVAKVQDTIEQVKSTVIKTVIKVVNKLKQSITKLIGVANKLTALLGEKLKIIRDLIKENIKKFLASLREIELLSRLAAVFNEKRQLIQELLFKKIESLKKKFLKLINIINFISKEKNDEQKQKKHKKENKEEK